jgi:hypothetical protein
VGRKDETDMNNREMIDDLNERFGGGNKREKAPEKKYIRVHSAVRITTAVYTRTRTVPMALYDWLIG